MNQSASTTVEASQKAVAPLPDKWEWVKLGDVCEVVTGSTPPKANSRYYGGSIAWIKPDALDKKMYVDSSSESLSDEGAKIARILPAGSVLVSCIGNIGKTAIAAEPLATNQQINSLIPSKTVDSEYLFFACKFIGPMMRAAASVSLVPILNKSSFSALRIPLPPLTEQKHIAAILKERMAAVRRARAAAETQLESIKTLPTAYLRAVFNGTKVIRGQRRRLGEILLLRKEVIHPRDNPKGSAVFVGLEHIESITGRRLDSVNLELSELTGRKPQFYKGDIVYGYLRPYLNKVWVADFDGLCSVDQYVYSVNNDKADTNFVAWFMRSPIYFERAPIDTTPGQLPRIRTEEVATVEIELPSVDEQRQITAEITERMSAIHKIRQSIQEQLSSIGKLPAALLRQAFSGRL